MPAAEPTGFLKRCDTLESLQTTNLMEIALTLVKTIMIAALLAGAAANAEELAEASPSLADKAALTALVEAWIDAEVFGDRKALQDILDEAFVSTFASGKTVDRNAYIGFIISQDIPPFTVTNDFMAVHGDTAVVIDVSESGKTKFTWIARRVNGAWKVIAQTFTQVASP
jgi:hypothetical protein